MQRAQALKEEGNRAFLTKQYAAAAACYTDSLAALETSGVDNEEPAIVLRCALLSNRAACSLPLKQYNACLEDCDEVLAIDCKKEARYRRGLAYEGL